MTLYVRAATLIDGTGRDPLTRPTVVIEDDRITEVRAGHDGVPVGAQTLDLGDLTVLPGLIDLHTHMGLINVADPGRAAPAMLAAQLFHNAELCLMSGHTTAREVAGADGGLREAIEAGLVKGPRLFPSGPLLSQSGGHGDLGPRYLPHLPHQFGVPGLTQISVACDGPEGVRKAARMAFRHGATQLKVCVSGGVVSFTDRLEDTQFTVEELRAAVEEARARDTYVTAHAHNVEGIRDGLAAGLECFEHGTFLDEETAADMAAARAALVPTLTVIHLMSTEWRTWGIPEEILPRMRGMIERSTEAVKIAYAAGVTVGSGTDILGPNQTRRGMEIPLKAEVVGAMAAIVAATATNARILRRDRDLGTVEPSKLADLVAVQGDPLTDPELFDDAGRVVYVVKGGEVVKQPR